MKLIKTEYPDFSRDESSHALINTNVNAYKQYKLQRENRNVIDKLNKDIEDLKSLVQTLIKNQS